MSTTLMLSTASGSELVHALGLELLADPSLPAPIRSGPSIDEIQHVLVVRERPRPRATT
jgi:hypothetical protein